MGMGLWSAELFGSFAPRVACASSSSASSPLPPPQPSQLSSFTLICAQPRSAFNAFLIEKHCPLDKRSDFGMQVHLNGCLGLEADTPKSNSHLGFEKLFHF
jgi:hypothetical protein